MRAALYLRQSERDDEGIDARQRPRTRALCEARGWSVAAEFVDNDVTASKPRGPQTAWGRMLAAIERDEVEVVVAVDLDRLLRSTRDLNTLIDAGAKVVTVDGEIDLSTADGEFRATMLAGIARFEGRRKAERQVRSNEARTAAGQSIARVRAFGFNLDGSHREDEATALRAAYAELLAGVGLAAIGRSWDEAGLTSTQGGAFGRRPSVVRRILENPRNVGWVARNGEVVNRQAAWEPVVDEATFLAVQALLADPSRKVTRPRSGRRLLTGVARCSIDGCQATVHATGAKASTGRYVIYRCSGSPSHPTRKALPVEEYVAAVVVARLSRPDARDLLFAPKRPNTDALRQEAIGARERLDALAVDYADGLLDRSQLTAATERLRARLSAIDMTLADSAKVDVLGPLVDAENVQRAWDGLSVDRQRAVVDALFERIVFLPVGRGTRTLSPGAADGLVRGARAFDPNTVLLEWRR